MEEKLRKLQQKSQLLTSYVSNQSSSSIQRPPAFIHSLATSSKFGEDVPSTTVKDNAHMFWMEKGVDTTNLMKSLEEGKTKLVASTVTSVSEFDVDGHIRQFHDNAISSTLTESQNLFDSTCSNRIWTMMDKEFMATKDAILNSEMKKTPLTTNPSPSQHIPIAERNLSTPPIFSQNNPNTDVTLINIYETAIKKDLFTSLRDQKSIDVANLFLTSLKNSKQDLAGEVFCWRLLIHKLQLGESKPISSSSHSPGNTREGILNSIHFLAQEYKDYMKKVIVRKRSIQDLPRDHILDIIISYIAVLNEGKDINELELTGQSFVPLWQLIYLMLRCNCEKKEFAAFYDDIRRHGGSTGNDIIRLLEVYLDCLQNHGQSNLTDLHSSATRIRGSLHRLIGAGCTDSYKLILFSILCNESPFTPITVTSTIDHSIHNVEQEVLVTIQDWLWYKLVVILLYERVFSTFTPTTKSGSEEDHTFSYLQQYIMNCDSSVFDANGTKPFSYVQNLIIINKYSESIQYLLSHNYVIPALMLSLLLYYYGWLEENDNYYFVCLSRVLPQLRNRIDLATYLVAVVRDVSMKMNFCIKILLLSPQYEVLVGKMLPQGQRTKGLFDELKDVTVDEVMKEAACVLNDQNQWSNSYYLFCLCKNYDNAATVLIHSLAIAYANNTPNKETILQKSREFLSMLENLTECDISHVNASSLQCLLIMIQIIIEVDSNMMNDAYDHIMGCLILPKSNNINDIQVALNNIQNLNSTIMTLFPELLLKCCMCINYCYTVWKNQYYVVIDEKQKKECIDNMNSLRSIIEGYEQFVGHLGITIPPLINDKLSQIVVSMA